MKCSEKLLRSRQACPGRIAPGGSRSSVLHPTRIQQSLPACPAASVSTSERTTACEASGIRSTPDGATMRKRKATLLPPVQSPSRPTHAGSSAPPANLSPLPSSSPFFASFASVPLFSGLAWKRGSQHLNSVLDGLERMRKDDLAVCTAVQWLKLPRTVPEVPKPHIAIKLDAKLLDACVGQYEFPADMRGHGKRCRSWPVLPLRRAMAKTACDRSTAWVGRLPQ